MIEVRELTMHYGSTLAVDNASFSVEKGTILGLLGPNGAGKSTIMNILATHISPTSGTALVGGLNVMENPRQVRKLIGYLPEMVPVYMEMEVEEYLRFVAAGRSLKSHSISERLRWVMHACGLKKVFRKRILELSKGYRQRVGIAQALVHDPEILILDEPTSGLDPLQIIGIRDLIKLLSKEKTIVVSTHILQEISAISDRIVIINEGKIIADGTFKDLEKTAADSPCFDVVLKGEGEDMENILKSVQGVQSVARMNPWEHDECFGFHLTTDRDADTWQNIALAIQQKGWLVKEFSEKKPTLEEAFITLTRSSNSSIW